MSDATTEPAVSTELMMGNAAFARGCLEAGIGFASAYPGSPSSEIVGELARVAEQRGMYVEWSTNEKVAIEAAAAAAYSGVRAVCAMKQLGINVASDFIMHANQCTNDAGLVLIVCDDPGGISSSNEQDTRPYAKWAKLPLLEPSDPQEAKEMTRWAFDLSEQMKCPVVVRGQTRISHSRANVELSPLPEVERRARFAPAKLPIAGIIERAPVQHLQMLQRAETIRELFETSPFNSYSGPEAPDLLIITSGVCYLYCLEAVEALDLEDAVGILKLGTPWPLPAVLVEHHLGRTGRVLFIEQVDPFLEDGVRELYADLVARIGPVTFHGKHSGHISPVGELGPSDVMRALVEITDVALPEPDGDYSRSVSTAMATHMIPRPITMCPGCAHRATFWSLKNVLKLVGGDGFTTGDVGCYTMGALPAGYSQLKTIHGMGSGTGLASGFGRLAGLGFTQPVVTVCGDSTFFHSVMPALVNAVYNRADFTLLVLDNSGTAMTGFQPHPGIGQTAMGEPVQPVSIEEVCESLGVPVEVVDPFDLQATEQKLIETIEKGGGVRVLILRRKCELIRAREEGARQVRISVDSDRCLGMACGCNRLCTRVFSCPGIIWDRDVERARIDEAICTACGVCVDICPQSAILREEMSP